MPCHADPLLQRVGEVCDLYLDLELNARRRIGDGPITGTLDAVSDYGIFLRRLDSTQSHTTVFYPWHTVAGVTFLSTGSTAERPLGGQ